MPCNSIILNKAEIAAANPTLLHAALANLIRCGQLSLSVLGARDVVTAANQIIDSGFVRLRKGDEYLADLIKQEYGKLAVRHAARKFNWRVTQKSSQKLTITRRV